MTDLRKAAEMALEALENPHSGWIQREKNAREALRQALARPEIPMSPEHLPQYIATNNIKPTTEGGGGAGGAQPEQEPVAWIGNADFVKGQFVEGRVRRVWWECNTGVGQPLYTAPVKQKPVAWRKKVSGVWHYFDESTPFPFDDCEPLYEKN
jgi:hypothetical protein